MSSKSILPRGTTPGYVLQIPMDLSGMSVYVTIKQGDKKVIIRNGIVEPYEDGCTVTIKLTQEQTLVFKEGTAQVQVRAIDSTGQAYKTEVGQLDCDLLLQDGVIKYAGDTAEHTGD